MPCVVRYHHCDYSVTTNLYFSIPSPLSSSPWKPLPPDHQPVHCIYESLSVLFVHLHCSLDFTYKWNHMVFLSFWLTYFIEHDTLLIHPCCHKGSDIILFYDPVIFNCIYVPQLFHPPIYWWHLGCFHIFAIVNNTQSAYHLWKPNCYSSGAPSVPQPSCVPRN